VAARNSTHAAVGAEVFPTQAQGSSCRPRRHSPRAFGCAGSTRVWKTLPVELAGIGNGEPPTTRACGLRLPLLAWGAAGPPLLQEPVFKAGPWRRLDCWRRSFQDRRRSLVGLKAPQLVADQASSWS